MSVVRGLIATEYTLKRLISFLETEYRDYVIKLANADEYRLEWMLNCVRRAIRRYKAESKRTRKYYRRVR